jgi:hypothetical protein
VVYELDTHRQPLCLDLELFGAFISELVPKQRPP